MDKFKYFLKNINENFSLIIAFPIILGGIWQLISLMTIDPTYIRFFSVTQLMADGLFIAVLIIGMSISPVIILAAISLATKIANKLKPTIIEAKAEEEDNGNEFGKYEVAIVQSFLVIILCIGIYPLYILYPVVFPEKLNIQNFVALPFYLLFIFSWILIIIVIIYIFVYGKKFIINETALNNIFKFYLLVTFVTIAFLLRNFNKSFIIPNNFENIETLLMDINSSEGIKDSKLLYFNDSYIFIQIKRKNINKVKVLKFDGFFDSKAVD